MERSGLDEEEMAREDNIPDPLVAPVYERLSRRKYSWVYFDLETTGLDYCHITQLSARCKGKTFNRYVIPKIDIEDMASRITGLTMSQGVLYKNREPLDAVSIRRCIKHFVRWLGQFPHPVLIAHNGFKFDARVLFDALEGIGNRSLKEIVKGFCDTLPIFKQVISGRLSYSQPSLVHDLLGERYEVHDARSDVEFLEKLVKSQNITDNIMIEHSQTLEFCFARISYKQQKDENRKSLAMLVYDKVITTYMADKIAKGGLALEHIESVYRDDGEIGITELFMENIEGKARVTKCRRVIEKLCEYLKNSGHRDYCV